MRKIKAQTDLPKVFYLVSQGKLRKKKSSCKYGTWNGVWVFLSRLCTMEMLLDTFTGWFPIFHAPYSHLGKPVNKQKHTQSLDAVAEFVINLVWGGVLASVVLKVTMPCVTKVEHYCLAGVALPWPRGRARVTFSTTWTPVMSPVNADHHPASCPDLWLLISAQHGFCSISFVSAIHVVPRLTRDLGVLWRQHLGIPWG